MIVNAVTVKIASLMCTSYASHQMGLNEDLAVAALTLLQTLMYTE